MNKKSQHMPSEATAWGLGIIILIILLFIFFPNLMGKIKDKAFAFGHWVVKDPDKPKLAMEIPQDLKDSYDDFFSILEKNKEGKEFKECLLKYGGLSTPEDYSIDLFEESGYSGWIFKLAGKEGGFRTNEKTVGGLKPCIVNAENFYNQYLAENKRNTGQKYIEADNLKIEEDKILFQGNEYTLNTIYLFKADGYDEESKSSGHICFFLTHATGVTWYNPITIFTKWGCEFSENSIDNDCMKYIESELSLCGP